MSANKLSIVVIGMLLLSPIAAQQSGTPPGAAAPVAVTPVVINVADPSGAPLQAQVRVIPPPPNPPGRMETDAKGQLALDLKPGGYAVFACAPSFAAVAAHIDVANFARGGASVTKPQDFPLVLQVQSSSGPEIIPEPAKDELVVSAHAHPAPIRFLSADLKALPHITVSVHNSHTNADETYSGVRLSDLLAKLGAPSGNELRGKVLADYVVATGSDGYKAVLALGEVDPNFHPGEVLVADTMDGKPLDAHSGPFKLVVSEDKRPARSVRNLVSIELKELN
jgi:hypothetical protein